MGGGGVWFRFACSALTVFQPHWVCPCSWVFAFPIYTAQAPGCSIRSRPFCVRFQFLGSPQKRGLGWAQVLCLPRPSGSGSQELDEHTLPRCSAPYPLRSPSLSFRVLRSGGHCVCSQELVSSCDPPSVCQPPRISGSLWLETEPVCSLVGDAISGAEFTPFPTPCLLPPARDGLVCIWLALLWDHSVLPLFSFWRQWAALLGAWYLLLVVRSGFVKFAQHSNILSMNL